MVAIDAGYGTKQNCREVEMMLMSTRESSSPSCISGRVMFRKLTEVDEEEGGNMLKNAPRDHPARKKPVRSCNAGRRSSANSCFRSFEPRQTGQVEKEPGSVRNGARLPSSTPTPASGRHAVFVLSDFRATTVSM